MVAKDETLVKRWCHDCGDTFDTEHHLVTDSLGRVRCYNPWLICNACGANFKPSAPLPDGQNAYELHDCKEGKVRARLDNPTCGHCGAPKARITSPCSCPEDTAERKAQAEAEAKKDQRDKERWELERLDRRRGEKEREASFKAANTLVDLSGLRKVAQHDRRDTELLDREQAVKDRELSRREHRQDAYDADAEGEGNQVEGGEPLAAFEMPMDGSDLDLAPAALLQRKDGATLLYDGKLNFIFGTPGGGKSWVALYCVQETLLRGRRAIYWDHEDTPGTLNRRSNLMGLHLEDFWSDGQFKYLRPGLDGSALARIHRRTSLGTALEEASGCSSESGIMVLEQKPARKQGAPNRCCHRTNPTVSASSLTTIAWWPMPACSCRPP